MRDRFNALWFLLLVITCCLVQRAYALDWALQGGFGHYNANMGTSKWVLLCQHLYPTCDDVNRMTPADDKAYIDAAVYGKPGAINVEAWKRTSYGHDVLGTFVIYAIQSCTAGTTSILGYVTTVQAFDDFGQMIPATVMPNPQCFQGCESAHATGGTMTCDWYVDPTKPKKPGDPVYVQCNGGGIKFTGRVCNMGPASDALDVVAYASKPQGYVQGNIPQEPQPGEEPENIVVVGKPLADQSSSCTDQNGDGLDDLSGETCSAVAIRGTLARMDTMRGDFNLVGTGPTMGSDLVGLAGKNGGYLGLPSQLTGTGGIFNIGSTCAVVIRLPGLGNLMQQTEFDVSEWCTLKNEIEPYLQFTMWVLTIFVCYTQFRAA